jgi:CCR4-NOT transcription complex subunit 7/8
MIFYGDGGSGGTMVLPPPPPPPGHHLLHPHPGMVVHLPMQMPVHMHPPPMDQFAFARFHLDPQPPAELQVRDVWYWNLAEEMSAITALLPTHPVVCIDTEFPGTVYDSPTPRYLRDPHHNYSLVRRNADELKKLLQLGLTLVGADGPHPVVWQFNFWGFDEALDPHAPASVAMLKAHGMDFHNLREHGIDPLDFAAEFARSGLTRSHRSPDLTWVAFSGSYDFAYLAKVLRGGRRLPDKLDDFRNLVGKLFGPSVLDVKYIAKACGLRGGLDQVAAALGVERAAGRAHNAGSDSLLTADVLQVMMSRFFPPEFDVRRIYGGSIDGLAA